MNLMLNQKEVDLLVEILNERQRTLRGEVQHTDAHVFKDQLKEKEKILAGLMQKLESHDKPFSKVS